MMKYLLILLLIILFCGSGNAAVCNCTNCTDCTAKLNNVSCTTVLLNQMITDEPGTCITWPASNKIFDCQGNTIDGVTSGTGIYLNGKNNNTIRNCIVNEFYRGIYIYNSDYNFVDNNTANLNNFGIDLRGGSDYNNITNCGINGSDDDGLYLDASTHNRLINNTINNTDEDALDLYTSSDYNVLENNVITNTGWDGIYIFDSDNNNLTNNSIRDGGVNGFAINSGSTGNILNSNTACGHLSPYVDIKDLGANTGDNNTCDTTLNWNDTGTVGCTYQCSPAISFAANSFQDNFCTMNNYAFVNVSVVENNPAAELDTFKFNWNGTNYTFYDDSLVLGMNFDNLSALGENSTHAYDFSASGNNGTISGATWTTSGKYGGALSFDGADDYVDCGNDASLDITDEITMEAWIKTTQTTQGMIVSKYDPLGGQRSYQFDVGHPDAGAGKLGLTISSTAGTYNGFTQSSTITVNDWKWHHVVVVFNPGVYAYIYIDGINRTGTIVGTLQSSIAVSTRNLAIGAGYYNNVAPNVNYFKGPIDEVRIYNRALGVDEIQMSYYSNLQKFNSTQWYFQANITNLTNYTNTALASVNNTLGYSDKTATRTIRIGCYNGTCEGLTGICNPDLDYQFYINDKEKCCVDYLVTDSGKVRSGSGTMELNGTCHATNEGLTMQGHDCSGFPLWLIIVFMGFGFPVVLNEYLRRRRRR